MNILLDNIKLKKIFFRIIVMLFFSFTTFATEEDPFIGVWSLPNNKVVIEIKKEGNNYVGYVKSLKEPYYPKGDPMEGQIQIDRNNPDVNLKNRQVLGLKVVGDLVINEEKNQLENGWIYDSWNGKLYYGKVTIIDKDRLKLISSFDKWGILRYSMEIVRVEK